MRWTGPNSDTLLNVSALKRPQEIETLGTDDTRSNALFSGLFRGPLQKLSGTGRAYLNLFWTSCQFRTAEASCKVTCAHAKNPSAVDAPEQARGGNMEELANHWYQAGSLFVQAGFLVACVWSVRAILKNVRASQERMVALLELTISGVGTGGENLRTIKRSTASYLQEVWPEAAANPGPAVATTQSAGRVRNSIWTGMANWMQAPMSSGVSPWRRAVRWLQAPAGS